MQDFRLNAPPSTARGCIATGQLAEVALKAKTAVDNGEQVLIFDDTTSQSIEVDFRGSAEEVLLRLAQTDGKETAAVADAPRGPGRPKLGVVAREITLLPRHWDWLNAQPGGASVALRKLVEEARRANEGKDRVRQVARGGLPLHVRHGGQPARFRRRQRAPCLRVTATASTN
jgi:hypothetical protein